MEGFTVTLLAEMYKMVHLLGDRGACLVGIDLRPLEGGLGRGEGEQMWRE